MDTFLMIITTFPNRDEAAQAAQQLLEMRLVACAQLSSQIESMYWWKGRIEKNNEYLLSVKTKQSLYGAVEKRIRENHSYETPEIVALPLKQVESDYASWLINEVIEKTDEK